MYMNRQILSFPNNTHHINGWWQDAKRRRQGSDCCRYNIEHHDEDNYCIRIFLAGAEHSELEISEQAQQLTVKYHPKTPEQPPQFLYQGFCQQAFEQHFQLAEYTHVTSAKLDKGILTIHLHQAIPEAKQPKTIPIQLVEHRSAIEPETQV